MSCKDGTQVSAKFIHLSYIPYEQSLEVFFKFVKFGAGESAQRFKTHTTLSKD